MWNEIPLFHFSVIIQFYFNFLLGTCLCSYAVRDIYSENVYLYKYLADIGNFTHWRILDEQEQIKKQKRVESRILLDSDSFFICRVKITENLFYMVVYVNLVLV